MKGITYGHFQFMQLQQMTLSWGFILFYNAQYYLTLRKHGRCVSVLCGMLHHKGSVNEGVELTY